MNLIKKIVLGFSAVTVFVVGDSFAQGGYFEDALRYSQHQSNGTARIMGIGGTQLSLGGDVSNISGNPAGLGFFRRSEASFTGSYGSWNSETTFLGQVQENSNTNFALPNLGVVISSVKGPLELGDWRGGSFGISINRNHLYTSDIGYYSDVTGPSSMLDFYLEDYHNFGEPSLGDPLGLPMDVHLIWNDNGIFRADTLALDNPFQDERLEKEGSKSQITFAYGGNYKNKLFVGGSVGITSINYSSLRTFNEEFWYRNSDKTSLYYSLQENLLQNGTGVDVSLGVIYKPLDNINLGLSFKSPTWTRINEEFDANIYAEYYDQVEGSDPVSYDAPSNFSVSTFNLRTPMKIGLGGTYFFNKNGFITADVEYIDYSSMYLSSQDFPTINENNEIKSRATNSINYRAGAEYRFDMFRIRAGAAFYGDPMHGDLDRTVVQYSGGIGARFERMYVDFGIIQSTFKNFYYPYPEGVSYAAPGLVSIDNNQLTGMLTLGFNF